MKLIDRTADKGYVQMICPPYKRGTVIGAGPDSLDIKGDDGHIYTCAPGSVVPLRKVEPVIRGGKQ